MLTDLKLITALAVASPRLDLVGDRGKIGGGTVVYARGQMLV